MRDIARSVGVRERTAYDILCDLVAAGYLSRERAGRRNCYRLHIDRAKLGGAEREEIRALCALPHLAGAAHERLEKREKVRAAV